MERAPPANDRHPLPREGGGGESGPVLRWLSCPRPAGGTASPPARTPAGTVIYAVGDVHGNGDLLKRMIEGIRIDSRARAACRRLVIFLGDYVNRGRDNRVVVEMARDPGLDGFEVVALKGNNEDLMLRFLDGDLSVANHWLEFGGVDTVADYGVVAARPPARHEGELEALRWQAEDLADYGVRAARLGSEELAVLEKLRRDFVAALPRQHLDFLHSLRVFHREGGYYFVHAGVLPGLPLERQPELDCMWIRKRFLDSDLDHGAVVVHGHSISAEPQVRHNRIGIDTGAYKTGVLTCLILDGAERAFLQAIRDMP